MSLIATAQAIVELKGNNRQNSDAFQLACSEFLSEVKKISSSTLLEVLACKNSECKEAYALFDDEIKKYITTMETNLSWKDFKEKNKDLLFPP